MEPKFQTSFIPKNPSVGGQSAVVPYVRERNLFSTAATIMFVLALLVSGGAFGYKIILNNNIKQADEDLLAARTTLDTKKIQELIDSNSRIVSTKNLLNKHVVVSELLVLLQQITLQKVSFSGLAYKNVDDKLSLTLNTEALSYNAIAGQKEAFVNSAFIKNLNFSDFVLDTGGTIKTLVTAEVVPKLISYKDIFEPVTPVRSSDTATTTDESITP